MSQTRNVINKTYIQSVKNFQSLLTFNASTGLCSRPVDRTGIYRHGPVKKRNDIDDRLS